MVVYACSLTEVTCRMWFDLEQCSPTFLGLLQVLGYFSYHRDAFTLVILLLKCDLGIFLQLNLKTLMMICSTNCFMPCFGGHQLARSSLYCTNQSYLNWTPVFLLDYICCYLRWCCLPDNSDTIRPLGLALSGNESFFHKQYHKPHRASSFHSGAWLKQKCTPVHAARCTRVISLL